MEQPFLTLKDISYQYPDGTVALNQLSVKIKMGQKIALLGNNGAGKSTLLLHLNAILTPTSGQLFHRGKSFTYTRKEKRMLRQQVGIVFQDPDAQLVSSSVYEDIKYGPYNMGLSPQEVKERVEAAMDITETFSLKEKPPHFLSIGQKKRVAIAGVLAMNPALMILDEPTAGLDPYYTERVLTILNAAYNEKRTILISTHDVDFAYEWADEVWVMVDGRMISTGSPLEVFQDESLFHKSHLKKPWIIDVFDQVKGPLKMNEYPRSRNELLSTLQKLNHYANV